MLLPCLSPWIKAGNTRPAFQAPFTTWSGWVTYIRPRGSGRETAEDLLKRLLFSRQRLGRKKPLFLPSFLHGTLCEDLTYGSIMWKWWWRSHTSGWWRWGWEWPGWFTPTNPEITVSGQKQWMSHTFLANPSSQSKIDSFAVLFFSKWDSHNEN